LVESFAALAKDPASYGEAVKRFDAAPEPAEG
jgi:hypothetical protein